MEIIYRQHPDSHSFEKLGISDCWVKYLHTKKDIKNTNPKIHHHTGFEIHIIKKGHQKYIAEDVEYNLTKGYTLIIPHKLKHRSVMSSPDLEKISLTFKTEPDSPFTVVNKPWFLETEDLLSSLDFLIAEHQNGKAFGEFVIESRTCEIVIQLLRKVGVDNADIHENVPDIDYRISMAKQYISDNIELAPGVTEVASYCYLSSKQLTRLFREYENTTPAAYIRKLKTEKIEKLLATDMSLREISVKMNFSDEFHFNSFFKLNSGMSPGEFRRMIK